MAKKQFRVVAGSHVDENGEVHEAGAKVTSSLPLDKMFVNSFEVVREDVAVGDEDEDDLKPVSGNPSAGMQHRKVTEDSTQTRDDPTTGMRKEKGIIEARREARREERENLEQVPKQASANVEGKKKAVARIEAEKKQDFVDTDDGDLDDLAAELEEDEREDEEEEESFGDDVTDKFDGAADGGFQVFKGEDGYTVVDAVNPKKSLKTTKSKKSVGEFLSGGTKATTTKSKKSS